MLFRESDYSILIESAREPNSKLGVPLLDSELIRESFNESLSQALDRTREHFGQIIGGVPDVAKQLDTLISEMWDTGWDPKKNDVGLFVRDFGLVLADKLMSQLRGKPVFRSKTDLTHMSLWWESKGLEVFPFHALAQRLIKHESKLLADLCEELQHRLAS